MPIRVCFAALHALPAIEPAVDRPVGGTETRAWMFARGLAQHADCDLTFVVRDEPGHTPLEQEGVRVIGRPERLYRLYESVGRAVERSPRFPGLRLRRWQWSLLWQLPMLAVCRMFDRPRDPRQPDDFFRNIDADLFVTFGVQANSARVIASARTIDKPAVLMIGSDGDLDERYQPGSEYVSPYGDVGAVCYWQIMQADAIVVQTEHQRRLLREHFGREGTVIANPIDLDAWNIGLSQPLSTTLSTMLPTVFDRYALWVGRAESLHKRPQLMLDLARRCPDVPFLMILNPRDPAVEQQVRAKCPANVHIIESVPFDQMPAVFARAAVFISTSALEGFPNVFLQAAASSVPIATLEVGREFIEASDAGMFAKGDMDALAQFVRSIWQSESSSGDVGRRYLAEHHSLPSQSDRLRELLVSMVMERRHAT